MPRFYLRTFQLLFALRALSVVLHFMGPSPWGGALVLSPSRFIPDALLIEMGMLAFLVTAFALGERGLLRLRRQRGRNAVSRPAAAESSPEEATSSSPSPPPTLWRGFFLSVAAFYAAIMQLDYEIVRWLGQHMSVSYLRNFAGARDGQLLTRILSADVLFTSIAVVLALAGVGICIFLWMRLRKDAQTVSRRGTTILLALLVIGLTSPHWFRPSDKRWRRIQPAPIGILDEGLTALLGMDAPHNPERARQDLIDLVYTGSLDQGVEPESDAFPLYRDSNVGRQSVEEFAAQDIEAKPDVIVIVFETMRGMNTGFLGGADGPLAAMPRMHAIMEAQSVYYPRMHSAGFPSVEGAMAMHLGMWPHHSDIVFSTFLHANLIAFPEMLRRAGYESIALVGADPSFSNFTPWFRRWYDELEYNPENHHDGPLVDRFIELHRERAGHETPMLMTLWTATTHPPYDVPEETGVVPDRTNELRYLQAMDYSDAQLHRLMTYLMQSPRWDNTLVFILGDHSQPTPWQWLNADIVGELTPGHTWTAFAALGGALRVPTPRRDEQVVSHIDLAPTILSAIDLSHPNHFFGENLLDEVGEREILSFRFGTVCTESREQRTIFRVDSDESLSYRFDSDDPRSYGALEGGALEATGPTPHLERLQDAVRAWGQMLEANQVAPATPGLGPNAGDAAP